MQLKERIDLRTTHRLTAGTNGALLATDRTRDFSQLYSVVCAIVVCSHTHTRNETNGFGL